MNNSYVKAASVVSCEMIQNGVLMYISDVRCYV